MEKLKSFSFNNLHWQYRQFKFGEIEKKIRPAMMIPGWLEPFAADVTDLPGNCKENLCRMIGITAANTSAPNAGEWAECVEFRQTLIHFVDDAGVAWPEDSIVVIPNISDADIDQWVCYLVTPKPRFS